MGYFSNGTEGDMYEAKWCNRCEHQRLDDGGCTVWLAHMVLNYDECNNKNSALHILIPRSEGGIGNDKCTMFLDKVLYSGLAGVKPE